MQADALRSIFVSLFTTALLLASGCRESTTEPRTPALPSLRLDAPTDAQVVGDTLLVIRGLAESPGFVARVSLHYRSRLATTSPFVTETALYYYYPGDTARSRVSFDTTVSVPAGTQDVTVDMDYRLPDAPTQPNTMTRTARVRVYRKPVLRIESGLADTLFQRSLSLIASMTAVDSAPKIELVVDGGTSAERRVTDRTGSTGLIFAPRPVRGGDTTAWFIDLPDTLPNGPHRLVLRVYDETGVADSVVYPFVTWVAPLPYTISPLPGLGGADSDARDVNASGVVAGWALDVAGTARAVTWANGIVTTLSTQPGAGPSQASALNDLGDVVGSVRDTVDGVDCERATRWTSAGAQLVGVGPDLCGQLAHDIAANGAMLIWKRCCSMLYPNINAWLVDAGVQTGLPGVLPLAVNDRSQVVGNITFQGLSQAQPYQLGLNVEMPEARPAFGHPAGTLYSVNNASQVLGTYGSFGVRTTFLSTLPSGSPLDLNPFLAGATPVQVTDNGTVLSFDELSKTVFLWRGGRTRRVTLSPGGWMLDGVAAMNDAGDIVGHATESATGRTSGVVLHPNP